MWGPIFLGCCCISIFLLLVISLFTLEFDFGPVGDFIWLVFTYLLRYIAPLYAMGATICFIQNEAKSIITLQRERGLDDHLDTASARVWEIYLGILKLLLIQLGIIFFPSFLPYFEIVVYRVGTIVMIAKTLTSLLSPTFTTAQQYNSDVESTMAIIGVTLSLISVYLL